MSFQVYVHTVDTKGKLQSSVAPTNANDLSTKAYVDEAIAAGGGDWFASVLDQLATPPGTPSEGDRYLVVATATGAWAGKETEIAEYNGSGWDFQTPSSGSHVYDEDSGNALIFNGTAWVVLANATGALIASNNLSDVPSAGSARANLGLGSLATASSVNLGTDVTGTLAITAGGTGGTSAAGARTNLGLGDAAVENVASSSYTAGDVVSLGASLSSGMTAITLDANAKVVEASLGTAASEDTASAQTDSGKIPTLGTISGSPVAVTVDSNGQVVEASLGSAASEDVASARSDAGKLPKLGTISGSPTAVTIDGGGEVVAASLGTAATANVATGLSSTGSNLLRVGSSNLSSGDILAVDANGLIIAGTAGGSGTVTSIALADDDGDSTTAVTTSGTIAVVGDGTTVTTNVNGSSQLQIAVADASTSVKGAASFSSSHFSVSSGAVSLSTVAVSSGGTGATSAFDARTNLGLTIGSDVQAYSLNLNAISSIIPSNGDTLIYDAGAWDKTTYGEFTKPIKLHTDVQVPSTGGLTIAPSSVEAAYELYILDLSSATTTSTLTLPTPGSGDVGKSIEVKVMGTMSASNKLTVSVSGGSDKFDGLTSIDMDQDFQRLKFTVLAAGGSGNTCYALG